MIPRPTSTPMINGHSNHDHLPSPSQLLFQSQNQNIDEAEHLRRRKHFIVYPIIPRNEITLISGSPRVGTTTLLTMMCDCYIYGKPVLGFPSYSKPKSATLLCHTHTKGVIQRISARMGIVSEDLHLDVMGIKRDERDKDKNTFRDIIKRLRKKNPSLEVIFLDGYHRLFRGNRKDYDAGADGTDSVQEILEDEGLTLVAVGRSTKLNADNQETSPMERFYGAVSTTERIATFISMERVCHTSRDNPKRIVAIDTQGKPVIQRWEFTNNGLLVPESDASRENGIARDSFDQFQYLVMARGEGEMVTSGELVEIGLEVGVSTATVARYRNRMIEQGMLRGKYGEYEICGNTGVSGSLDHETD